MELSDLPPGYSRVERYRLLVSYRGTDFAGWQRQNNARTVQETLESGLGLLLRRPRELAPLRVVGAGRTDAGVHARGQVAHCDLGERFPCSGLVHGGNHHLPDDVRILRAERMSAPFDARRDALIKEYRYRLSRAPVLSPLDAPFVAAVPQRMRTDPIREALTVLIGRHDFGAFAKTGSGHRSSVRTLLAAELEEDGERVTFLFRGDGFLRGMVRALVGTLIEIGIGTRGPETIATLLRTGERARAGPNAPAHGLCLERVDYGESLRVDESFPDA
jgi:tRNA pseudouridine38-40 synthase